MAVPRLFMKLTDKLSEKVKEINGGNGESTSASEVNSLQPMPVVPQFAVTLQEAKERIVMLQQFVKEFMVPNEDYGLIPGCQRPSLFKPGAEKLTDVFGLSKHLEITNRVEEWEKPFLHYEVKVTLLNKRSGHIEAEGIGSANSREKKFIKQDTYSIANSLLKIAKKRALVDAVLSATRSSGLFTQDVEDIFAAGSKAQVIEHNPAPKPIGQQQLSNVKASEEQLKEIYSLAEALELTPGEAKQLLKLHYKVSDSRDLTEAQARDFIRRLKEIQLRNKQ